MWQWDIFLGNLVPRVWGLCAGPSHCASTGLGAVAAGLDVKAAAAAGTDNAAAAADTTDVDGVAASVAASSEGLGISMVDGSGDAKAAAAIFSMVSIARRPRKVKIACLAATGGVGKTSPADAVTMDSFAPAAGLGGKAALTLEESIAPGLRAGDVAAAVANGRSGDASKAAAAAGGRLRVAASQ